MNSVCECLCNTSTQLMEPDGKKEYGFFVVSEQ